MYARRCGLLVSIIASLVAFPTLAPLAESEQAPSDSIGSGQASTNSPGATAVAKQADKDGIPLAAVTDLSGAVSVEAVLLPYSVAKRSFGKEVAEKYAVVSLVIANREQKQGMILQSVSGLSPQISGFGA